MSSEDEYLFVLEEIALRCQDQIDEEGFFPFGTNNTVSISAEGQAEVTVRGALAHSGIAIIDLPAISIARYLFEPVWAHRYLLEYAIRAATLATSSLPARVRRAQHERRRKFVQRV